ncbi:ferredoxin [Patescibacteria group bacterium]|nr:ferredoxin [Patescibacteria group bacterium]
MKITLERSKCIGCGSCVAVCDRYFEMGDDNLSKIKGGQMAGENMELETADVGCAKEAAEVCPVQTIKIQ